MNTDLLNKTYTFAKKTSKVAAYTALGWIIFNGSVVAYRQGQILGHQAAKELISYDLGAFDVGFDVGKQGKVIYAGDPALTLEQCKGSLALLSHDLYMQQTALSSMEEIRKSAAEQLKGY